MAEPNILNLDTIVKRDYYVRIHKKLYGIKNAAEFAVLSGARFKVIGQRITELAKLKNPTHDQVTEFDLLTAEFIEAILIDAPPKVVASLTSIQRLQTIQYFFQLPGIKAIFQAATQGANPRPGFRQPRKSRSKRSSPSSTRSTAAIQ